VLAPTKKVIQVLSHSNSTQHWAFGAHPTRSDHCAQSLGATQASSHLSYRMGRQSLASYWLVLCSNSHSCSRWRQGRSHGRTYGLLVAFGV